MTKIQEVREQGLGSNFKVLDPEDGYRQDNTLWFGDCENCGERVSSSLHDKGVWMHTEILELIYHDDSPSVRSRKSQQVDYCPASEI